MYNSKIVCMFPSVSRLQVWKTEHYIIYACMHAHCNTSFQSIMPVLNFMCGEGAKCTFLNIICCEFVHDVSFIHMKKQKLI